ncbi:hypothetical protein [Flavobacterium faecale]|uniref:hypothetical protein n=1 Tax=Flavobacterium faecale TaxID=1355330 RepID=UPI003AAF316A
MNIIVILSLLIYIIYELFIALKKRANSRIKVIFYVLFTCLHFGVSFASCYFLNKNDLTIDAVRFHHNALQSDDWMYLFNLGSDFISFLVYPFVKLNVSFEVLFFLFATVSFKGFLILFDLLKLDTIKARDSWVLICFLMPSLHYWTGLLGKEALLMYLMSLLLVKVKQSSFDFYLLVIYGFIFLIRPHLCFVLGLAFLFFILIDDEISRIKKLRAFLYSFGSMLVLLPLALMFFLNVEEFDVKSINDYINRFLYYTQTNGQSRIDLIDTNVFERILYLLFMPLPYFYPIKNKFQLAASFENVLFLSGFFYLVFYSIKNRIQFYKIKSEVKYALMAGLLMVVLFGSYLYNLGLGNRMRAVFLPYIFYFFVSTVVFKEDAKV